MEQLLQCFSIRMESWRLDVCGHHGLSTALLLLATRRMSGGMNEQLKKPHGCRLTGALEGRTGEPLLSRSLVLS